MLYISGYSENVIAHHQQVEQGVALLTKPFSTASLAEKIRLLLD